MMPSAMLAVTRAPRNRTAGTVKSLLLLKVIRITTWSGNISALQFGNWHHYSNLAHLGKLVKTALSLRY
jgi:hypothetical protein